MFSYQIVQQFVNLEMNDDLYVPSKITRYFWTPCQKWSNGKKPFKLAIQIIKIFVITAQIYKFGSLTQGNHIIHTLNIFVMAYIIVFFN